MNILFGKLRKSDRQAGPLDALALLAELEAGHLACRLCGRRLSCGDLRPLSKVPCPCGNRRPVVPRLLDSFYLFEFVDKGGMGLVYRAVSPEYPGEMFAVKVLHRERRIDEMTIEALINEARRLRKFEGHPHIMQAVAVGEESNDFFFVSEFIEGERLDRFIDRTGPMPVSRAVDFVLELLRVDRFIWSKGYLYRDLKPENVLLRDGRATLVDFGLCVSLNEATLIADDDSGLIDGAPHFMPPERLAGEPEGVYSETYSLGMILYYCITGQTLFPSGDAQAVAEQYLEGDRSAPRLSSVPAISRTLEETIRKAISLQIPGRYQSFDRFEKDLKRG